MLYPILRIFIRAVHRVTCFWKQIYDMFITWEYVFMWEIYVNVREALISFII